jgi:hypothetical protein
METLNREGSLLDEARRRAKEIASAFGINDRFQLLTQDFEGKHQRMLSRDEFNDAVDAVKISPQSRDLRQIINRQQSLLNMQHGAVKIAYIISDFQKNIAPVTAIKTDSSVKISLVQIKANKLPNVAVDSIFMLNAVHRPGDAEKVVVNLHNYADEKAEKVPLKLTINGMLKALGSYTINPRAVQHDTLTFSGLEAGWQQATVQLQDNPVTFDNQFFFTFDVKKQMDVSLVDAGKLDPYLNALFAADRFFRLTHVTEGNVDYARLGSYPMIVVNDLTSISAGLAQQLKTYVIQGGSLVVFPAVDADLNSYRTFLQSLNTAYPLKLVTHSTKVSSINLQSPVFKNIFESYPQNPDLPVVKKYYPFSHSSNQETAPLMTLENGLPFWLAGHAGKGKVYVTAVPLDEDFSNLPRHALFVPIMFRIALLSGHDQPLYYTIGKDDNFEIASVELSGKQLLKLEKGEVSIIPAVKQADGSTQLYVSDQIEATGIYALKKQDSSLAELAFNDNRRESDMSYLSSAQLKEILPGMSYIAPAGGSLKSAVAASNFGLQLWKVCIILTLIFLAAEIILIRFYKPGKRVVITAQN